MTLLHTTALAALFLTPAAIAQSPDEGIRWLVQYDGGNLPPPQWTSNGGETAKAQIVDGALRLLDDSAEDMGCYRTTFEADPSMELVVEAKVRVASTDAWRGSTMQWPWRDGSPVGILVSDGKRQEGLMLCPDHIGTFTDRFAMMDTTDNFHTYRAVIRDGNMSIYVDGQLCIGGKDAFWKPAPDETPFIQFGSSSKEYKGEALWSYVKVGVRAVSTPPEKPRLKITIGQPWTIPAAPGVYQTRPYLYNVGEGLLLMSVAQGPDAIYEPYGILKSTDAGKTWTPIEGLQQKTFAPQPMIRMSDGSIYGASRWVVKYQDGLYTGISYRFDPKAEAFTMYESTITLPKEITLPVFDRDIFRLEDDTLLAVIYDDNAGCLVKSTDRGRTWEFFSKMGERHEPGVAFLSDRRAVAILRQNSMVPLHEVISNDGGKTWGAPIVLEAGSVDPDLVAMSNGVLACSYGRPASCVMFSADRGRSWCDFRVVSDEVGFNYTTLQEVSPGRLLYIHDAPVLTAVYVDVERMQ